MMEPFGGFLMEPMSYFSFQLVPQDVTKAVVCAILSVGWCIQKKPWC